MRVHAGVSTIGAVVAGRRIGRLNGMGNLGGMEVVMILLVALIVLGPKKAAGGGPPGGQGRHRASPRLGWIPAGSCAKRFKIPSRKRRPWPVAVRSLAAPRTSPPTKRPSASLRPRGGSTIDQPSRKLPPDKADDTDDTDDTDD